MSPAAGTAGLGAGLALAGVAFASPSLIVPGFALGGLVLVAVLWTRAAARGAAIDARPGPARIVEGDSYPLRLALRHGLAPPPGGRLTHPLLDRPVRVGLLGPRRLRLRIRMTRRGRHRLAAAEWTIRDPLGLSERRITGDVGRELMVLPRVEPVEAGAVAPAGAGAGRTTGDESAAGVREARAVDFEVDGLRAYREGSPVSRIHWPALARTGELYERRMVAGGEAAPLVVLDAERPDDEDALDRAVRAAASLCVHLAPVAGCAALLPGRSSPTALDRGLRTWPLLHGQFAEVVTGARTVRPSRAASHGTVFWVTGGSRERAARMARTLGRGPHYVVAARDTRPGPVAFRVAGCTGSALGTAPREPIARAA